MGQKLAINVIMDCRTSSTHNFETRWKFKKYDTILIKHKSLLTKILNSFERENMQAKYDVLGHQIDLYFHDYKLPVETDKNWHSSREIDDDLKNKKP